MADNLPLDGLLDRASHVFFLAFQLGDTFRRERGTCGGVRRVDPTSWGRHQPVFNEFCAAVLDLRDVMQNPPHGFAPVAQALLKAASLAKSIRDVMQTAEGRRWAEFMDYFPDLNSVAAAGHEAIHTVNKAQRLDDPFAFVDQPKSMESKIDTTPMLPRPPSGLTELAAREIPGILANVKPKDDGAIELIASHLAKRLQDANHTLAAAHWAIHEAIQVGRLQAGLIEVDLPGIAREVAGDMLRWGGPDNRRTEWIGGGKGTVDIPKGKPAPFDKFKVTATPLLWTWWHTFDAGDADAPEKRSDAAPAVTPDSAPKRSTERGEGRAKLIATLTKHHQYADGSCLNLEPIGNNVLAKTAGVSPSTASAFFNDKFEGHVKYRVICRDAGRLADSLKALNGEFSPHDLYGRRPPDEDDRDDKADEADE